jgi:hypothetical protein
LTERGNITELKHPFYEVEVSSNKDYPVYVAIVDSSIISSSVKDSLIAMAETLPSVYSVGLLLVNEDSFSIFNLHSPVPHSFTVSTDEGSMVGIEELFSNKSPFLPIETCKASFITCVDSIEEKESSNKTNIVFGKAIDVLLSFLSTYDSHNYGIFRVFVYL